MQRLAIDELFADIESIDISSPVTEARRKHDSFPRSSQIIKLNVGGESFTTTLKTLVSGREKSMLSTMFGGDVGRMKIPGQEDTYFIDHSPKYFDIILNYLRDGSFPLCSDRLFLRHISREADFFRLRGLQDWAREQLHNIDPKNATKVRELCMEKFRDNVPGLLSHACWEELHMDIPSYDKLFHTALSMIKRFAGSGVGRWFSFCEFELLNTDSMVGSRCPFCSKTSQCPVLLLNSVWTNIMSCISMDLESLGFVVSRHAMEQKLSHEHPISVDLWRCNSDKGSAAHSVDTLKDLVETGFRSGFPIQAISHQSTSPPSSGIRRLGSGFH
eukprot:TRINITY_DN32059_c3_g1_i1.p1 TRINITY_DN32059_c3_g1~~TRINITY_DN32059_c3_g1_i1.p1  ORF type:complete len:330 (-),score=71.26 TRINITY_DN32059_c3_g1_i1:411-1400(-)